MRRLVLRICIVVLIAGVANAASQTSIRSVKLDRVSLNLAAGEVLTLTVDFARSGTTSILVVDRDGYSVRTLAKAHPVNAGTLSLAWDGRDDNGVIVADEAYSFKIDWRSAGQRDTYFPADIPQPMNAIAGRSYDRRTATLSYTLPKPSRVHIQAGTAVLDPKTKQLAGPVMKTIVNREPRAAGSIAEHWTGSDESSAIYIPDLQDFVVAIAATPLPENSVITFGNRKRRFVETLSTRRGASLLSPRAHHQHHAALRTEDDVSPSLSINPLNAAFSSADRQWIVRGQRALQLRLSVEGPTAASFRTHPSTLQVFIDGRKVAGASPKRRDRVTVPLANQRGLHRVSVNWCSEWGPVAANTIQVRVEAAQSVAAGGTR